MFAIFYKDEFINWWHNQKNDSGWIERTIAAMGWDARYVQVSYFAQRPSEIFMFEGFKSLKTITKSEEEIKFESEEDGKIVKKKEKKKVFKDEELPVDAEVWFDKGKLQRPYDSI